MENLFNCDGRRFRAKIKGVECEGEISVEDGTVYLCQNKQECMPCRDKLGYKYSWFVGDGSDKLLAINFVNDFHLLDKTAAEIEAYKDFKVGDIVCNGAQQMKVIYRSGDLVVLQLENGRASKNYTVTELYDDGWRLKYPRPEGKQECEEVAYTPQNPPHFRTVIVTRPKSGLYRYITVYEHTVDEKAPTVRYDPLLLDLKGEIFTGNVPNGEVFPAADFEKKLYKQTLEANGYEFDDKKNTVHKYQPKKGDLVVFDKIDGDEEQYIAVFGCHIMTPSIYRSRFTRNEWKFSINSIEVCGHSMRRATPKEALIFSRILSENWYKYDVDNKEVLAKWNRAAEGENYMYVENGNVVHSKDFRRVHDNDNYYSGNYFLTRDKAEEVAAEFRKILENR